MRFSLPQLNRSMTRLQIYTDGSCLGNPGRGGFAAVIYSQGNPPKHLQGNHPATTNNRMELCAILEALKSIETTDEADIYTDSCYAKNGILSWLPRWKQNNWTTTNKTPVKNLDLWQEIDKHMTGKNVKFHWVKGHSTSTGNNLADKLAREACLKTSI